MRRGVSRPRRGGGERDGKSVECGVEDGSTRTHASGHYDGVIRNNVIAISPGFTLLHNTVIHPDTAFASISHRFPNTNATLENNLVKSIRARDGSTASGASNLEGAADDLFVDVAGHDLHLAAGACAALDQGVPLLDAGNDIDGEPHTAGAPDLGADER